MPLLHPQMVFRLSDEPGSARAGTRLTLGERNVLAGARAAVIGRFAGPALVARSPAPGCLSATVRVGRRPSSAPSAPRPIAKTSFLSRETMLFSDLSAHSRYDAIVLDVHPPIGWHISAGKATSGGSGSMRNDIYSAMRVDRADRACISVLPLRGSRRHAAAAARVLSTCPSSRSRWRGE